MSGTDGSAAEESAADGSAADGSAAGPEEVTLARHGRTEWNLAGRMQGQLDSPLTADGLEQARANAAVTVGRGIDAIFCSPLGRARTTAGVYAEVLGLPVVVVDDLREVSHGEWAGLTREQVDVAYPGARARRQADKYGYRFPGGESYADADARAGTALGAVLASGARRPLIVSHAMVGRMLLRHLLGLDVPAAFAVDQDHEVVHVVRVATRAWTTLRGARTPAPGH